MSTKTESSRPSTSPGGARKVETLLVGAGAVGQVLGYFLQKAGARVTFLVRPQYAEETRRGLKLRPLRGNKAVADFTPDDVVTSATQVAERRYDAVVLCVSSTALRKGDWLAELSRAAPQAIFVAVQPGLEDPALVGALVPRERLVWGMFPLMSWGEDNGIAFYLPPATKLPFAGAAAAKIAAAFKGSGIGAKVDQNVPRSIAFSGALLEMHVIGLECADWSFSSLAADKALLRLMYQGLREALSIAAYVRGGDAPFLLRHLGPWASRVALRLMPRFMPFDVERYFRTHFNKVGDQTVAGIDAQLRIASVANIDTPALAELRERISSLRAKITPLERAS
jgi:2-dehydropantoate 2-reductase